MSWKAVDMLLRQAAIPLKDDALDEAQASTKLKDGQLLDLLGDPNLRDQRFVLVAPAGFGKSVYLKKLAIDLNQRGASFILI